jgi:hypothetical protein
MLLVFALAAIGLFLIYFIISSIFDLPMGITEIPTLIVAGLLGFLFLVFLSGLSAGLSMTYQRAITKSKTSLLEFYDYAVRKAPVVFGITLLRDFLSFLVIGPAIGIFIFFLEDIEYMDYITGIYVLFCIFIIHMLFTPSIIAAGAFNDNLFGALRKGFKLIRQKHINFIGLYIIFAIAWVMNFVPVIQLFSLFFIYPLAYTALIVMMEKGSWSLPVAETKEEVSQ